MTVSTVRILLALSLMALPACRHREDTQKADLDEAGYRFTAEDWFRACAGNDRGALTKFVAAEFPSDSRNPAGDTGLHAAAAAGARGSAEFLLDHKLPVDVRGANERTPLMAAVVANQTAMVQWLLRQGADAHLKDKEGFKPLMLAAREGSAGAVGELAARDREDLDAALLLAAMMDRPAAIDALTSFGASVHARMDDERTPLMVAAENGNRAAVAMLLEVGASRLAIDAEGRTAAELAAAAGHGDLAAMILREPLPADLALETPEMVAQQMDQFVDSKLAKVTAPGILAMGAGNPVSPSPPPSAAPPENPGMPDPSSPAVPAAGPVGRPAIVPLQDQTVTVVNASEAPGKSHQAPVADVAGPAPALVMRHYREKIVPVRVRGVQGNTATLVLTGTAAREVKVKTGEAIPGSNLVVVHVRRRMEDSKVSAGKPAETSVVSVRDRTTGVARDWIAGVPSAAHEPAALVEDAGTGRRYLASAGQQFRGTDGLQYSVLDVRPNQMVIRDQAGVARTIALRGPRG